MTIARAQMYRQLYQMGGIGSLPMDFGQSLQVPQQMQPSFSSAQNITMNPLLNYGQTPLTMASGGITRLGYQEGGMDSMMQPQMQDPMMQQQMQQPPLEGIMNAMPQEAGGAQQGQGMEQQDLGEGDKALLTIIQLLIEQGIDPQIAEKLARQILQAFTQGGEPAVDELANQLEQQEGMQETAMMANGGIMGYANRQNYGLGKIVKSVAKAVKSVAKSPIGRMALTIGATMLMGPGGLTVGGFGASLTGNAFLAGAINAGFSNLLVQGITTGKLNFKEALISGAIGGAVSGFNASGSPLSTDAGTLNAGGLTDSQLAQAGQYPNSLQSGVNSGPMQINPDIGGIPNSIQAKAVTSPNIFEQGIAKVKDYGTNLMNNPLETIGKGLSTAYSTVKENAIPLAAGFVGGSLLAQQPGETDEAYSRRAQTNPDVAAYITQYGGQAKVYSPGGSGLYAMEKAVDPFAGRSTYVANGGRIGYEYGSMPTGEPRRNQAGIMELDYRRKGGFVPPVGIKEKADDIPAMLSNNEFVFTADAVRNAGRGNVNKGAEKMYGLMKQLEAGGMV